MLITTLPERPLFAGRTMFLSRLGSAALTTTCLAISSVVAFAAALRDSLWIRCGDSIEICLLILREKATRFAIRQLTRLSLYINQLVTKLSGASEVEEAASESTEATIAEQFIDFVLSETNLTRCLHAFSVKSLKGFCRDVGIQRYSRRSKTQLVALLAGELTPK